MNELIDALRICSSQPCCDNCPYDLRRTRETSDCWEKLLTDAAYALERLAAEVDRKDKVIQRLLDAVDKKNVKIDLWKRAWKTAYKLYEATKESKGEQDGTEQNR